MFPIINDSGICGRASIFPEGLYCRIRCKCEAFIKKPCRIILHTGERTIDLGTCLKSGGAFIISTRIPRKMINMEDVRFIVELKDKAQVKDFVQIDTEKPFPHLDRLEEARMINIANRTGICFTDQYPIQQDNDQNP